MRDGSLQQFGGSGTSPNLTYKVWRYPLTGFDGSGNPIWPSRATFAATVNSNIDTQPKLQGNGYSVPYAWPSTNGVYVIYQAGAGTTLGHPHLGAFVAGNSSFIWQTHRDECMHVPLFDGGFPSGDNTRGHACPGTNGYGGHAGINAYAEGKYIYSIYDGQYATWGNKFDQWSEDGLLIGEFTQASPTVSRRIGKTPPLIPYGFAANFLQAAVATVGSDQYLWVGSESGFTPLSEWHISNLGSIVEATGSGRLGSSISLTIHGKQ
jgi:hypothetical protein